jgi:hypothetical protein
VGGNAFINNEILLVTDFVNLEIKLIQSFRDTHKNKIYIYVFIRMSNHTYFLKKS